MKEINIQSGEMVVCDEPPACVQTIVGVCIAVCLWDRVEKRGGMCHFRLPEPTNVGGTPNEESDCAETAVIALLRKFKECGSAQQNLEARVVGGGELHYGEFMKGQRIGVRNIEAALGVLTAFGIPVVGKAVGGPCGRQIQFMSGTGALFYREVDGLPEAAEAEAPLGAGTRPKAGQPPVFEGAQELTDPALVRQIERQPAGGQIKILMVGNAAHSRKRLTRILEEDPRLLVVAHATDITAAEAAIEKEQPDVITLNMNTKSSDWMVFIKKYMEHHIIPTVIVSTLDRVDPDSIFNALKLGVFDFVDKNALSDVHGVIIAAYKSRQHMEDMRAITTAPEMASVRLNKAGCRESLIVVGSSTGGVEALEMVLKQLPKITPPICIVQHIPKVYSKSLASQLDDMCAVRVTEAVDGTEIEDSHVYIAEGGRHMKLVQMGDNKVVIRLTDDPERNGFRPSVDHLFDSAQKLTGKKLVGVLLTGMGKDGAAGLLRLKQAGAYTIAQNEATSVVFGMAKAAADLGAVSEKAALNAIATIMLEASVVQKSHQMQAFPVSPQVH